MCEKVETTVWRPNKYIGKDVTNLQDYAIVLLNRPINVPYFDRLWNSGIIRHAVDGGLNHFLDYRENYAADLKPPDIVSGDFDSCSANSMEYARSINCDIIQTPDQNETDFTKAIRILAPRLQKKEINDIVVVVETCGRIDQIMANINTLFKAKDIVGNVQLMMLSSISLTWLLAPGIHVIHIPEDVVSGKLWCGLIPFTKTKITTHGLKWDLDNHTVEFGGMVSTSNTYKDGTKFVKVVTDNSLLWAMGISENED